MGDYVVFGGRSDGGIRRPPSRPLNFCRRIDLCMALMEWDVLGAYSVGENFSPGESKETLKE